MMRQATAWNNQARTGGQRLRVRVLALVAADGSYSLLANRAEHEMSGLGA